MIPPCEHSWTEYPYEGPLDHWCIRCGDTRTQAELDATKLKLMDADREIARLKARVEALESDMATIQRLAEAGLNDEAVSEICALDDIYSVTQGLSLDEEG